MSRRARFIWLSLLIAPVALAQSGSPRAPAPAILPPAAGDTAVPQRPTLSGPDMITQGKEYRGNMDKVVVELNALIEQARKQKDVIRLNCLMDKLMQVKASMNIADQALRRLQEAVTRRDEGASLHEYTRITIVNQKVQVLQNEGQTCVGAELNYIGATRVDVEAPDLPEGVTDPTLEPPPLERPQSASIYR